MQNKSHAELADLAKWLPWELPSTGYLPFESIVEMWVKHISADSRKDIDAFISLKKLESEGYVYFSYAVHPTDAARELVRTALERLAAAGEVTSLKDGTRWRLAPKRKPGRKKLPTTVRELSGDPNFRRGGR